MSARGRLVFALAALLTGCATVDVYDYAPRPLPSGLDPLETVSRALRDVRSVNWGDDHFNLARRARLGVDAMGLAAAVYYPAGSTVPPIYLTYRQIIGHLRAVTRSEGLWSVRIWGHFGEEIQLEFTSQRSARLFLDAAAVLARQQGFASR